MTEFTYRGYRVIQTTDPAIIRQSPDEYGFVPSCGFIVRDEFDENPFPVAFAWFYTPHDAIAAIEVLDTVLPSLAERVPQPTFTSTFMEMWRWRKDFWCVFAMVIAIENQAKEELALDDDPKSFAEAVRSRIHTFRSNSTGR